MAAGPVLEKVVCFLEIIQSVRRASKLNWDQKSFENSLGWARFCCKIFKRSSGKPYAEELAKQIKNLNFLPWNLEGLEVNLNLMRDSLPILTMVLLYNPKIELPQKYLFELKNSNDFLLKETSQKSQNYSLLKFIDSLLNISILPFNLENIKSPWKPKNEHVESLISFIFSFSSHFYYSDRCSFEVVLSRLFSSNIFYSCFLFKEASSTLEIMEKSLKNKKGRRQAEKKSGVLLFKDWLEKLVQADWKSLDKNKNLIIIILSSLSFFEKFLNNFFGLSESFEICYHENKKFPFFSWVSKSGLSYLGLKKWVSFIESQTSCQFKEKWRFYLKTNFFKSEVNLWRTICQELNIIL